MNDSDGSYSCQSTTQELTQTEAEEPDPHRASFAACDVNGGISIPN